jgi:hypothetical protein
MVSGGRICQEFNDIHSAGAHQLLQVRNMAVAELNVASLMQPLSTSHSSQKYYIGDLEEKEKGPAQVRGHRFTTLTCSQGYTSASHRSANVCCNDPECVAWAVQLEQQGQATQADEAPTFLDPTRWKACPLLSRADVSHDTRRFRFGYVCAAGHVGQKSQTCFVTTTKRGRV